MAEELKDLGGLVNKDMAFSKVQPNVVYDSENFRITTDDGATLAVRSNIKGNTFVLNIPDVPCKKTIQFDLNVLTKLYYLQNYEMNIYVECAGASTTFAFTYTTYTAFLQDFVNFVNTNAIFTGAGIVVTGNTYSITPPPSFYGYVTLEIPASPCGTLTLGSIVLAGSEGDTPLGYTPIDENFKNLTPANGAAPNNFCLAVNPYVYSGSYPSLTPVTYNPSQTQITDTTNQWSIENYWCNGLSSTPYTVAIGGGYMYTNMATGAYDTGYNLIPSTGSDNILLYNEVWTDSGSYNPYLGTAITSYTVLGENLFNVTSYGPNPWNYKFSYSTGNVNTRDYEIRLKVYLYMGDSWYDPAFTYDNPVAGNGTGFFDGTKPCAIIYNNVLASGMDHLDSGGGPEIGSIPFSASPASNGATENPVYVIFLEIRSIGVSPLYQVELYLDYFKVTGPVLNLPIATVTTTDEGIAHPILIGWTTLRDDIYLFTTTNEQDPDQLPYSTGDGQIWRFTYDKTGDYSNPSNYNIDLVYSNNALDFTTYRPIANPGMIEARYENEDVQKIYWTDNYNVPRQINVAPSQAATTAALTVNQLNLIPALTMEPPYITGIIDGGQLHAGVYQVIYRLQNLNNTESRFSRPSNSIPLFEASTSTGPYGFYPGKNNVASTINYPVSGNPPTGTPIDSGKAIRVEVKNLDTTYNEIEFATIYYKNDTDVPEIKIVRKVNIPPTGYVSILIDGYEETVDITLGESTAFTTAIRRCKTLTAKKQTLFLGNITVAGQDVEYDTRAYRFPINNTKTKIWDTQGNNYTVEVDGFLGYVITEINGTPVLSPYPVPADHDCIQNYDNQDPSSDKNYLYKYNSDVLGGSGPNLEYEFYTDTFVLDGDNVSNNANTTSPRITPFSNDYVAFDSLANTIYYQTDNASFTSYASPFRYSTYVGYRRDEMYRFGMVFYDELDNPTYVNWIGDIRMPHIWMPDTTHNANPAYAGGGGRTRIGVDWFDRPFCSDTTYYDSANKILYAKPLALKVIILNNPSPVFTHGSIVRAERTDADKHITGQGLIRPTYRLSASSSYNNDYVYLSPASQYNDKYGYHGVNQPWWFGWTMFSPEFLNFWEGDEYTSGKHVKGTIYSGYKNGDKVEWLGLLEDVVHTHPMWDDAPNGFKATTGSASHSLNGGGTACTDRSSHVYYFATYIKNYSFFETGSIPNTIKNPNGIPIVSIANGIPFNNRGTSSNKGIGNTIVNNNKSIQAFSPLIYHGPNINPPYDFGPKPASGQFSTYSDRGSLYVSSTGDGLFLELDPNQSWTNWSITTNDFLTADNFWDSSNAHNYLANYKRTIPVNSAYGGNSYFARAGTEYIYCNNFFKINSTGTTSTIVYGGDTIVTLMSKVLDYFDTQFARDENSPGSGSNNYSVLATCHVHTVISNWIASAFPVETSVPVDYRRTGNLNYSPNPVNSYGEVPNRLTTFEKNLDYTDTSNNLYGWSNSKGLEFEESFRIDSVFLYNFSKSIYRFFPKQPNAIVPNTYDCRIWRSQEKTDGEQLESWSIFKPSLYKDVESAYGPINNLIIFQDKMFYFQDKGFGVAQVDEQKVMQSADPTASDLVLGSSGILERYDYISTKTGTKHQFSMSVSDYSIIWFDALARKMYRYKPDGLIPVSDMKGLNAYLYNVLFGTLQNSDNPYRYVGIHSTYDFRHNEFYMTFLDKSNEKPFQLTLVYNDLLDGYVGEYTHYPKVYINDKLNIFSPNPLIRVGPNFEAEQLFIHNYGNYAQFYGTTPFPSKLSFILNSNPTTEKVLNNLEIVTEAFKPNGLETELDPLTQVDFYDFFDYIRVYDNYQNTDWVSLINNTIDLSSRLNYARKHKSIWNIRVPSDIVLDVNANIFDPSNLAIPALRPKVTRRFKDKWFMVEFQYDNTLSNGINNKFVVHSAKANYAINSR